MEALRHALLDLHRILIEHERVAIERDRGRLTAAEMWKLLVEDPALAWLGALSAIIVRIDEAMEGDALDEAELRGVVRALLVADEGGNAFQQQYATRLQVADVVIAHRAVTRLI
jgi:hypothetical protein